MLRALTRFTQDESGTVLLEYGWVGFLISIVIYTTSTHMGQWYVSVLSQISSNLVSS
jgi:Flp pilus assembly pilin Flp